MPTDLILYALVAAGLVFWLRNVLGTRHGDERERGNPFTTPVPDKLSDEVDAGQGKTLALAESSLPPLPRNVSITHEGVTSALKDLSRQDTEFDLSRFSQGAQDAFVLIVESFAAGDRETLKNLLEPSVYAAFDSALDQREKSGQTMSAEIHAVRKTEIMDCRTNGKTAYITIRFIADETSVNKDKDGTILSGDPDRITEMNDIWTFSRTIKSRDPRWLVHETRDGNDADNVAPNIPQAN